MLPLLSPPRRRLQHCSQTRFLSVVAYAARWSRRHARPGKDPQSVCGALCALTVNAAWSCCALSRQREIEQVEAQMNRLAKMQLRQTAPAAGLEPLTEEQQQLATDALGPGPRDEVLVTRAFKCACRLSLSCKPVIYAADARKQRLGILKSGDISLDACVRGSG